MEQYWSTARRIIFISNITSEGEGALEQMVAPLRCVVAGTVGVTAIQGSQ